VFCHGVLDASSFAHRSSSDAGKNGERGLELIARSVHRGTIVTPCAPHNQELAAHKRKIAGGGHRRFSEESDLDQDPIAWPKRSSVALSASAGAQHLHWADAELVGERSADYSQRCVDCRA